MHLTRLEVTNWRGLPSQVVEFDPDVTVVGGPNESGKSSLRAALRAALLLPTGARGEKKVIEANRPWDSKLYPKVRLDLEIGDKSCCVEKEFLRTKQWATLHFDGRLIAQDDDVQPRLMELLGAAAEWLDVLWGVQGELALDRAAPDSLKGSLASAAQDTVMPQVAELQRLLADAYSQYWTEKRGAPTKKVQNVRDEAMRAEKAVRELEEKIACANRNAEEVETSAQQLNALNDEHRKLQAQWQQGQESLSAWESYARAAGEAESAQLAAKSLEQWLSTVQQTVDRVRKLVPRTQAWQTSVDEIKKKLGSAPSRAEVEELAARMKYLELSLQRDRYAEAESMQVPLSGELRALRDLQDTLREIDARLKMGEFRAKVIAERELNVKLQRDGGPRQELSIQSSGQFDFAAEQSFNLVLPGVATLQVESGNPSISQDIERRSELQQQLEEALNKWAADSVSQIQDRATEKETRLRQLRKPESRVLASARAAVADADDLDELSLEEREDLAGEIPSELAVAENAWNTAQGEYQQNLKSYQELTAENPVTELATVLQGLEDHWRSTPADISRDDVTIPAVDEISDDWLDQMTSRIEHTVDILDERREAASELFHSLARPEGDEVTRSVLQGWQQQIQELASQIQGLTASVNQTIGTISAHGDLFAQLVSAREALARAAAEEKKMDTDALAMKELHLAFDAARQQLQKDVVAPLQEKVSERFSFLTSGFYSGVAFDSSFKPNGIATSAVSGISLEDLSFGTREQLSLLTRICLAELLYSSSGRQIVILDDNLVHTDEHRMSAVCNLMEEAAETVQIIVFTCHPERYSKFSAPRKVLIKGRS